MSKIQGVPRDRNVSKPMGRKISVQNPAYQKEAATCNHTPNSHSHLEGTTNLAGIVTNPFCSAPIKHCNLLGIVAKAAGTCNYSMRMTPVALVRFNPDVP